MKLLSNYCDFLLTYTVALCKQKQTKIRTLTTIPEFLPCLVVENYSTTIINVLNNTVTTYMCT